MDTVPVETSFDLGKALFSAFVTKDSRYIVKSHETNTTISDSEMSIELDGKEPSSGTSTNEVLHPELNRWKEDLEFYPMACIGYPDHEISKDGRIRTIKTGYITSGSLSTCGRQRLHIRHEDGKKKSPFVSELMGLVFLGPRPSPAHTVDHIDRDELRNVLENLRWSDKSEQCTNQRKPDHKRGRAVVEIDLETGEEVRTWFKIRYAVRHFEPTKIHRSYKSNMSTACKMGYTMYGRKWKYCEENIPGEEWRQLKVGNSVISVSNKGRIYDAKKRYTFGYTTPGGYKNVSINKKSKCVHRLVMYAFHGKDKRHVNHKDGNKKNNRLENLEYVTDSENMRHSYDTGLSVAKLNGHGSKRVIQMDLEGNVIREFKSGAEAGRAMGVHGNNITGVCKGVCQTAAGYRWKYGEQTTPSSK